MLGSQISVEMLHSNWLLHIIISSFRIIVKGLSRQIQNTEHKANVSLTQKQPKPFTNANVGPKHFLKPDQAQSLKPQVSISKGFWFFQQWLNNKRWAFSIFETLPSCFTYSSLPCTVKCTCKVRATVLANQRCLLQFLILMLLLLSAPCC